MAGAILLLQLALLGSVAIANAEEANSSVASSHPHFRAIKKRALKQGYDLSTQEGRKAYHDYLKTKRIQKAAALGFDLTTPSGRKAYRAYRHSHS